MREIGLLETAKFTSPNPLSLICTRQPDVGANLATVSWWTFLSIQPPRVGFAMMKTSFSGERIRAEKQTVLAIPGEPMARQVMGCGSTSGRDTDKAERFGIELMRCPGNDIEIPVHSVAAMFCSLREFIDAGDHYFYICDVTNVYANDNERALFAWNGYSRIAPASMQ